MPGERAALLLQNLVNDKENFKLELNNKPIILEVRPIESSVICAKTTYFQYVILVICPPLYVAMRKGFIKMVS